MKCTRCGWKNCDHDPNCPVITNKWDDYKAGYRSGRSGSYPLNNASETWKIGWRQGTIALEEHENV